MHSPQPSFRVTGAGNGAVAAYTGCVALTISEWDGLLRHGGSDRMEGTR